MATLTALENLETGWAEIKRFVEQGKADFYHPGDVVTDTLKDGREFPFVVAAVNHYKQDELIFVFGESLCLARMNKYDLTTGGWKDSELRKFANSEALALMPGELQKVIAPITIVEMQQGWYRTTCKDKLWAPSEKEVSGKWGDYDQQNEVDKQFPYFAKERNRLLVCNTVEVRDWWTRTARTTYSHTFAYVSDRGKASGHMRASCMLAVCLGFAIRKTEEQWL